MTGSPRFLIYVSYVFKPDHRRCGVRQNPRTRHRTRGTIARTTSQGFSITTTLNHAVCLTIFVETQGSDIKTSERKALAVQFVPHILFSTIFDFSWGQETNNTIDKGFQWAFHDEADHWSASLWTVHWTSTSKIIMFYLSWRTTKHRAHNYNI